MAISINKVGGIMKKELLVDIVDKNREAILDLGNKLYINPELGYKEFTTKKIIKDFLESVELSDYQDYAITGLKATIGEGNGPHIALLCDMDAIPTANHPLANKEDQAAHTCGHHSQMTIMLGAFKAIADSGILKELGGKVSLITAPAEEFVDFDYRLNLIKEGKIKAFSGKQNLIIEGAFDDVDAVLSSHGNNLEGRKIEVNIACNGFIAKTAVFKGKSAHAGAYPHKGKNALNAAVLSLNAVGLLRETFRDEEHIRVHPIIKKGGTVVNTVPDEVIVETYVRGANVEAILEANEKVDNAFIHCAKALSCECEINNIPGYLPSNYYSPLSEYIVRNAKYLVDENDIINGGRTFASDDLADVSNIVPVIQIGYSGFSGDFHSCNFNIEDPEMAYIIPSKLIAMTVFDMLQDVEGFKSQISAYKPTMTKEEYMKEWLYLK
jgi:amidohydrolase